jgi:predicted nuclease of predicted toxin-antitoxin system
MLRLVSDEDVNGRIIRGLRRREPGLDIVRTLDVGLAHRPDPEILQWAADQDRVLVTEDVSTMIGFAWQRVKDGQPMTGVLALTEGIGIGRAIEDILTVVLCYDAQEIKDQVLYLPL